MKVIHYGTVPQAYPSKHEDLGLAHLEAMRAGWLVMAARYTAIPEVCGAAACCIEPGDPNPSWVHWKSVGPREERRP